MRGTLNISLESRDIVGLIPTYAGNTQPYHASASHRRAHPHVCGEHFARRRGRRSFSGSSPRMRGTRRAAPSRNRRCGLIPTYAGNTKHRTVRTDPRRAHPHVCGEHVECSMCRTKRQGSSPRMRGTPTAVFLPGLDRGLIPTYAGNTTGTTETSKSLRAHPHVCGEHRDWHSASPRAGGSSPRMRGTPDFSFSWLRTLGLIPTYAGNTPSTHPRLKQAWAHPHVCGEHSRPPSL